MTDSRPSSAGAASRERGGEWYAAGLRFGCTQCGNCCTGPPGYVWFTDEEGQAIARLLGLTETEFLRRHARSIRGKNSLVEVETSHGRDCVFLDRAKVPGKAVCSIYGARPSQCRTWPFWPENVRTKHAWERVKKTTPCPGMDSGRLVPIESIRIQRDTTT